MCWMELTSLLHPTPPHGQCIPVTLESGTATITRATNTSLSHRLRRYQTLITHTITRHPTHHRRTHTNARSTPRARASLPAHVENADAVCSAALNEPLHTCKIVRVSIQYAIAHAVISLSANSTALACFAVFSAKMAACDGCETDA